MNKSEAGRRGWLALQARLLAEHKDISIYMATIGKAGAARFFALYELQPVELSRFAIVRKSDGAIINYMDGNPFAKEQS